MNKTAAFTVDKQSTFSCEVTKRASCKVLGLLIARAMEIIPDPLDVTTGTSSINNMDSLRLLILAGGQSSRMGFPKHLLPVPSTNQPLYKQLIQVMYLAFPETHTVHFSFAGHSALDNTLLQAELSTTTETVSGRVELKLISDEITQDIGPAAGLLAARQFDPTANWLVVACDFPLLHPAALCQLREAYEAPVTCFVNGDGFSEPLLGIWSPQALQKLRENVEKDITGPNYTVKRLKGKLITPMEDDWILNTNTREEWDFAKSRIRNLSL